MRAIVVALAAAVALVPAAGSATTASKTIGTNGYVISIAADGPRLAIRSADDTFLRDACEHAAVWTATTSAVTRLPKPACDEQSDFQYESLTIAGARVAWVEYDTGNHAYCYGPYTTVVGKKTVVNLEKCEGEFGETGERWVFAGDGDLLVGMYSVQGEKAVTLYRVASGLTKIVRLQNGGTLFDVEGGRIMVRIGSALGVFSKTGARVGTAPGGYLPKGAVLRDIEDGVEVYSAAGRLILSRGNKSVVVASVRGLVDADLEPSGLFYAHNSGRGDKPGRVTFIPRANLPK